MNSFSSSLSLSRCVITSSGSSSRFSSSIPGNPVVHVMRKAGEDLWLSFVPLLGGFILSASLLCLTSLYFSEHAEKEERNFNKFSSKEQIIMLLACRQFIFVLLQIGSRELISNLGWVLARDSCALVHDLGANDPPAAIHVLSSVNLKVFITCRQIKSSQPFIILKSRKPSNLSTNFSSHFSSRAFTKERLNSMKLETKS